MNCSRSSKKKCLTKNIKGAVIIGDRPRLIKWIMTHNNSNKWGQSTVSTSIDLHGNNKGFGVI